MRNTFEAGQEVRSPIVEPRQVIRRSRELKIRDFRQLIVPPRRINRGVRSEVLVKRIVQALQGRSDDLRSTSGTGGDLELPSFEALSDGRNLRLSSLPGLDVVRRRGGETDRVCGSGSYLKPYGEDGNWFDLGESWGGTRLNHNLGLNISKANILQIITG